MIFYNIHISAPIPNQLAIEYPVQSITAKNVKSTTAAIPKTSTTASVPPPASSVGDPAVVATASSIQNTVQPEPTALAAAAAAPATAAPPTAVAPPPLQAAPSAAAPSSAAAQSTAAQPPPLQAAPLQYSNTPMISQAYMNPVVSLIAVSNPEIENGLVNYGMDRYFR